MSVVERRYAEALLATAHSSDAADKIGEALKDFSGSFKKNAEIGEFFLSPVIKTAIKKETLLKIIASQGLREEEQRLVVNFLSLILDKGRFGLLVQIAEEYKNLKDILQKNLEIKVFSAKPLENTQLEKITEKYKKQYGAATAYVNLIIDPTLLGGVQIQIGDIRINDTQSGRLNALKRSITGAE